MGLNSCSQRIECPNQVYPQLEAIDKIPDFYVKVEHGSLDQNNTKKAFSLVKALRVSEHYYYTLISEYRKEFINE